MSEIVSEIASDIASEMDIMKRQDFKSRHGEAFERENMMGPNSVRIIEELTGSLKQKLKKGMRILDLGCGRGLTSIFLAEEFEATVFAVDLWISATENHRRFRELGLDDRIIPIHAEAHDLPFSEEYFDLAVCIDAYHYFGADEGYLTSHLAPLVKKGGEIAVGVPGLKREFTDGVPPEMQPYWFDDINIHSCDWWLELWKKSEMVDVLGCSEMKCCDLAWKEWLVCDNDYARRDIGMMQAEGGKYFNIVSIIGSRR